MSEQYKQRSQETFDQQAKKYYSSFFGQHAKSLYEQVEQKVNLVHPDSILDIGCGTGEVLARLLSKNPQLKASGLDLSTEMLKLAKDKLGNGVELKQGDSEKLPWEKASFNMVICTDSFHHYPNPQRVLAEIYRVLKRGGTLIISEIWLPAPFRQITNFCLPYWNTGDYHVYSKGEIKQLMIETGFKLDEWKLVNALAYISTAVVA